MSTDLQNQTQDYNPLTGDIQLNPAAWGLSLQDINSAATISLKSSIYAGNVNLTADQYREIQSLVKTKYSGVDYTGMINGGGMTPDISMTGRDPGLYMNQERIGFWKDDIDQWQAYIANNGNFAFKGDANNYISWNGSELVIRGTIYLEDGTAITDMNNTFHQDTAPLIFSDGDLWFDTNDGNKMYLGKTGAWVSVQDALISEAVTLANNAQATADGKIDCFYQASAPVTAGEGDIWFDTDDGNKIYTRRSGVWVNTQDTKIGDAITAAAGAQATADGKVTTFYLPTSTPPTAGAVGDLWYDTTSTILKRWSGSAWQDARDVGATRAAASLDSNSRYTKWLESNLISETKTKTGYTGVVLDNEGIGGYTAGVATFRVDRLTGAAFYAGSISAAGLDVGTVGNIRGGQTAYNTGTGFFLGYSGGAHKFSIGNVTNSLTWNGTDLLITGALTSTATITGGSFRTYNATTLRYSEITPGKISLQNNSNIDIVSIDGSNFRYINADAFISANTHYAFQTITEVVAGLGSTIGFDFGTYNDSTKAFSSYGSKLLFNYNTPSSVDSLTVNEIKNFTAPNYSTTGPILYFKGYVHMAYLINASFVGRMKIPVGTNLY